jgi:hypothetical protein
VSSVGSKLACWYSSQEFGCVQSLRTVAIVVATGRTEAQAVNCSQSHCKTDRFVCLNHSSIQHAKRGRFPPSNNFWMARAIVLTSTMKVFTKLSASAVSYPGIEVLGG